MDYFVKQNIKRLVMCVYPVLGEEQVDGGVVDDVHAQLEGQDLP